MDNIKEIKELLIKDNKIDKSKGSLHNSWRSKVYNKKGKKEGFSENWSTFEGFKKEMSDGWEKGLILIRKNTNLPYSKENCIWANKGDETVSKLIKLQHNGQIKTLIEWCDEFNLNYGGVKARYYKYKNKPSEEILFGIKKKPKREIFDINVLNYQKQRDKASKMISAYKCKDKKRNLSCDLDVEFMINLMNKPCIYCGDTQFIGADRINNSIGHVKNNVLPCCYTCNTVRNNVFSYEEMLVLGKVIRELKNKRNENK